MSWMIYYFFVLDCHADDNVTVVTSEDEVDEGPLERYVEVLEEGRDVFRLPNNQVLVAPHVKIPDETPAVLK